MTACLSAVAVALFLVTTLAHASPDEHQRMMAEGPEAVVPALRLTEASRRCTSSRQCVQIATRCDGCDCGASINQQYQRQHEANLKSICRGFTGARCELACSASLPSCVMGLCVLLPDS